MMPTRKNIQVNGKLPLHSTVEPQTAGPARETAPKISKLKPSAVPPRETAPKVSEFEPPTTPLAAFVSLHLYTQPLPYATLSPEGLLLPELEALQYKEATPLKKSVSQSTDQVLLATENSAVVAQAPLSVVAQAPLPLLSPPTENPVVVARATTKIENLAAVAKASWPVLPQPTKVTAQPLWPVLWLTQNPDLQNQQFSYKSPSDSHSNQLFLCTQIFSQPPRKNCACQLTRMHLQQLSQGRKPSQNLNPEKLRSTRMPPTPLSKELPSLSASTIDTLFSFPRELPTPLSKELPSLSASTIDTLFSFPRELPVSFPRELQIAFPMELPLMPELPVTSPGKLPAQHWSTSPGTLPAQHWYIPTLPEKPPVPTRKPPDLMREAQRRELTSAPTREPTALVDHRKIADLKINHIESIDRLKVSHKELL
jgi:hypothetical protein